MTLYRSQLADVIREEQQQRRQTIAAHQPDDLGLCRACCRVHPCDEHTQAQAMLAHYSSLGRQSSRSPYWRNSGRTTAPSSG